MNTPSLRFYRILVLVLFAANVLWALSYFSLSKDYKEEKKSADRVVLNEKVVAFQNLFIEKVLNASGEVDFDTRLTLENAVRDIKDEAILAKWKSFLDSKNEQEAQVRVKELLQEMSAKLAKH